MTRQFVGLIKVSWMLDGTIPAHLVKVPFRIETEGCEELLSVEDWGARYVMRVYGSFSQERTDLCRTLFWNWLGARKPLAFWFNDQILYGPLVYRADRLRK